MNAPIVLIVNADDFGLAPSVNRGIIAAHTQGIVASASLMVLGDAVADAVQLARLHANLSIGLHLDLGEWSFRNGKWCEKYVRAPLEDRHAVAAEIDRQLQLFQQLLGRNPTHIDSHQHVHRTGPASEHAQMLAEELHVPLRHNHSLVRYCGDFYGQWPPTQSQPEAVSVQALHRILLSLEPGITELACHPGEATAIDSDYSVERAWELSALCDPSLPALIATRGVLLRSFDCAEIHQLFPTRNE